MILLALIYSYALYVTIRGLYAIVCLIVDIILMFDEKEETIIWNKNERDYK